MQPNMEHDDRCRIPIGRIARCGPLLAIIATAGCRSPSGDRSTVPRVRAPSGSVMHWAIDEVRLEPVAPPSDSGLSESDLSEALELEARAWNKALEGCDVPVLLIAPIRQAGAARTDGRNVVVLRTSSWCPSDSSELAGCYDEKKEAITHVRPQTDGDGGVPGEICEADVEINAVNFRWSSEGSESGTKSLRAVLGHELGHVLGLDHSPSPSSIMYPTAQRPALEPGEDAVRALCPGGVTRSAGSCSPPW